MDEVMPAGVGGCGTGATASAPEVTLGTDAAYAPARPPSAAGRRARPLRNVSEMRHFFRTNDTPIYFVGATPAAGGSSPASSAIRCSQSATICRVISAAGRICWNEPTTWPM